ncbi:hypothetical protein [Pseudoalteromonas lipolytica]|uniref:hypothetical protein n=1 Tax=Pseudoalteromonas lipolytica TaxID=570156 RepID=UPI0030AB35C4
MLKNLDSTVVSFKCGDIQKSISLKGIFILLLGFGLASALVSAIFGVFLNGILNIFAILISPLAVAYLVTEFKEPVVEFVLDKACISGVPEHEANKSEKEK